MEQITRVTHYPQTKLHIPSLWLPPYLLVVLVLTGGFMVAILSIRMLPQTAALPDPFASVADIFAAQIKNDLQGWGFSCSSSAPNYADSSEGWCTISPPTGMFSMVAVRFVNGVRGTVFLTLREDTLSVGDLVTLWGRPHIDQYSSWGQLDWPDNPVTGLTVSYKGRYSLFISAGSIVFKSADDFEL